MREAYATIVMRNFPSHKCKTLPQLLLLTEDSESPAEWKESFEFDGFFAEDLQLLEVQDHSLLLIKLSLVEIYRLLYVLLHF